MHMKHANTKKPFITLTFIILVMVASLTFGLMGRHSTNAKSGLNLSNASTSSSSVKNASSQDTAFSAQSSGIIMPKTSVYALNANNTIFVLQPGETCFSRLGRVTTANGNLIGIDFRVSDGLLYAVTDTGSLYTIGLTSS